MAHIRTKVEEGQRQDNADKWEDLKRLYWNAAKREFFGRGQNSWAKAILFYTLFYTSLLLMMIILLAFALLAMDDIEPFRTGGDCPLQNSPGVAMRPIPDLPSMLIRFVQGKPQSYKPYADHIQSFLLQYENEAQVGENFIDCVDGRPDHSKDNSKVCRFDVNNLGDMCTWQRDYGYDEGQPCLIFKLNKIFNWEPDLYSYGERPAEVGDRYDEDHIGFSCEGEFPADRENLGNITYEPERGFPKYFYPYLNQEGYRSPLVMVRFTSPANGMVLNVICKAWARNVRQTYNDWHGLIRFQLLID